MPVEAPTAILKSPIVNTPSSDTSLTASAGDFNTFLTLLTAQLRNQDPLSPMEGTEFVAQLATFSSVEQLIGVNSGVDDLNLSVAGTAINSLSQWIGQNVSVTDGSFRSTGGPVQFVAPSSVAGETIEAEITTPDGKVVGTIAVFPDENGLATWDGRNVEGNLVEPRDLKLTLKVTNDAGTSEVPGEVLSDVLAIRGTPGGVVVDLADGRAVAPEAIGRVQAKPTIGND